MHVLGTNTREYHEARCDINLENFTITAGDIFEVLNDESSEQFKIETSDGEIGFISPTHYRCSYCLSKMGWYAPHISRRAACKLLNDHNVPVGSFLVRNSEHHGAKCTDHHKVILGVHRM